MHYVARTLSGSPRGGDRKLLASRFGLVTALMASAALVLAVFGQTTFAQSPLTGFPAAGNSSLITTVPAIPELSPSISEAEAIFKLASRLEVGDATFARDDVLARRLYRIAAEAGHAGAQCNLGAMLMDGSGGPTDLAGGAALFRKAALRGHGLAQYNLGVMHALGDGVVKDAGEAMAWIEQAINRLPEGEAMASAKAWREHLRNRMSAREGMIARNRSQELGDAVVRELAAASTGSASRAARSAVRAGLDELGLSPEALQRLGLAPSGAALMGSSVASVGGGSVGGSYGGGTAAPSRSSTAAVAATNAVKTVNTSAADLPIAPVETALQEWLNAWSDRRVEDYLNFYDPRFAPLGGVGRVVWSKQRRAAIRRPNWVKVRADQISTTEMSAEEVVVGFVQVYSASTGHRETTRKSMIWRWSDGRWRIVSEQSTKMTSTLAGKVAVAPAEPGQASRAPAAPAAEALVLPAPAASPATTLASPPATPPMASLNAAPNSASFEPAVRAWVKAWNDRQVDAYLAFYGPGFEVPGGQDRATWAAERRDAITRPAWIKVRADHLKTTVNGESAEARFFQVYVVAPGSVELVNKSMRWVWTDGRWQIVREESEPLVRKHAKK